MESKLSSFFGGLSGHSPGHSEEDAGSPKTPSRASIRDIKKESKPLLPGSLARLSLSSSRSAPAPFATAVARKSLSMPASPKSLSPKEGRRSSVWDGQEGRKRSSSFEEECDRLFQRVEVLMTESKRDMSLLLDMKLEAWLQRVPQQPLLHGTAATGPHSLAQRFQALKQEYAEDDAKYPKEDEDYAEEGPRDTLDVNDDGPVVGHMQTNDEAGIDAALAELDRYGLEDENSKEARKRARRASTRRIMEDAEYEKLAETKSKLRQLKEEMKVVVPEPEPVGWRHDMKKTVESGKFEFFFACVIISNSLVIGAQLIYDGDHIHELDTPIGFVVVQQIYAGLFAIELGMKLAVQGKGFFYKGEMNSIFWNYLDLLIVCASFFEIILAIVLAAFSEGDAVEEGSESGAETSSSGDDPMADQMKIVRIIRITRVLRVMRVIKVVKFIRALASLVGSIVSTLKQLMWSLALLSMVIYVFSIVFTDTVISELQAHPPRDELDPESHEALLYTHFGSLHRSWHTLFRCICGGMDWADACELLVGISWFWGYLFTIYLSFCYFAVLNVMTAVFCHRAIESAAEDQENVLQNMLAERERQSAAARRLFAIFDSEATSGSSDEAITLAEFESMYEDKHVQDMFQALDLRVTDAWTLFRLLDGQGNGDIDQEEFVESCLRLRGPARAVDVALILDENSKIKRKVSEIDEREKEMESLLTLVGAVLTEADAGNADSLRKAGHWEADVGNADSLRRAGNGRLDSSQQPEFLPPSPPPASSTTLEADLKFLQPPERASWTKRVKQDTAMKKLRVAACRRKAQDVSVPLDDDGDICFDVGPILQLPNKVPSLPK